jgi:hypothetical protein
MNSDFLVFCFDEFLSPQNLKVILRSGRNLDKIYSHFYMKWLETARIHLASRLSLGELQLMFHSKKHDYEDGHKNENGRLLE